MTEAEIKTVVLSVLGRTAPEADLSVLTGAENLRQTLDIDSYDFLMFLVGLNEAVGVDVPEGDYGQLISLNDVVRYIVAHGVKAV